MFNKTFRIAWYFQFKVKNKNNVAFPDISILYNDKLFDHSIVITASALLKRKHFFIFLTVTNFY